MPDNPYDKLIEAMTERRSLVERLRRGSGGSEDDPYTGREWYRAQIVAWDEALRLTNDTAAAGSKTDPNPAA